ncbi:MAG TPA: epoxyqueuosine reductase QueH [Candidatus Woesearchaeota archaeon]|nr:epoxyqueuosine reductase QueH [Candidatus Woesearchaeota archaeon]
MKTKNILLLHICCAPCATQSLRKLKSEGYESVGYFYNPNIYPKEEHDKRYYECLSFCNTAHYSMMELDYDYLTEHKRWLEYIKGLENEKENGKRCLKCFEFRLKKAFEKASSTPEILGYTTTLTVSPYKNSKAIFQIANKISKGLKDSEIVFLEADFKKEAGFEKSVLISKEYGLYRQDYCGCEFSMRTI